MLRRGLLFVFACAALACDRPPSAEGLREWTPADHDQTEANAKLKPAARGSAATNEQAEAAQLVEATWRNQCLRCHGLLGRGDGPEGPMYKPTDLTSAEWQAKVSDGDIAATIKNGKNKMPKFSLPDSVVQGIVRRIRASAGAEATAGGR